MERREGHGVDNGIDIGRGVGNGLDRERVDVVVDVVGGGMRHSVREGQKGDAEDRCLGARVVAPIVGLQEVAVAVRVDLHHHSQIGVVQ